VGSEKAPDPDGSDKLWSTWGTERNFAGNRAASE
jgi:hypothetical protein